MSDEDLELLITLDYPWYAPDEDTFNHQPVTNWPGQPFAIMGNTGMDQMIPSMSRSYGPGDRTRG